MPYKPIQDINTISNLYLIMQQSHTKKISLGISHAVRLFIFRNCNKCKISLSPENCCEWLNELGRGKSVYVCLRCDLIWNSPLIFEGFKN